MARRERPAPAPALPRPPLGFLVLTVAVSGALVMVIEVMGSRVIGPFFGVSLFVWTSLITVTLVALALGYAVGGFQADRRSGPDALYAILLAAGLAALLIPVLQARVIRACAPLGLRSGSLLAAALLFGPCLFLLGCVSPLVVRLATVEMSRLGRTVGLLYAVSTLGSVLGTVLTGFVLIAYLGVGGVFLLTGGALLALAVAYWLVFRRRWLAALLLLAPALLPSGEGPASKLMANGTRVTRVARRDGFYGRVQVLDYRLGPVHTRELLIDGLVQGGIDVATGQSIYEYAYYLERLPWGMKPDGRTCLVVGLGAGIVPAWYEARGVRTDVVDINPDVVAAARAHFGFRPSGQVFLEDARRFLARPGPRYDYVILDVFAGDTTPAHLLTREAVRDLAARVAPGGLVAINLIGSLGRESFGTASAVRTLESVFPTVELFPTFVPEEAEGFGNVIVVARSGPPLAFDAARVAGFPVHALARDGVARLGTRFRFPEGAPAIVLTDDYNPVDFRDTWVKERLRASILSGTDWEVLL